MAFLNCQQAASQNIKLTKQLLDEANDGLNTFSYCNNSKAAKSLTAISGSINAQVSHHLR
jgi:hypothetical protein